MVMPAFDPASPPNPLPLPITTKALWDTGATRSVLAPAIVTQLGLAPVGRTNVQHVGGTSVSQTYLVNLHLPNNVGVAGLMVTEFHQLVSGFGVLVGMDVISQGDFALTHVGGKSCMSFRIPPCEHVDYVAEANRSLYAGTNPNAPCPCGKKDVDGKPVKYKKCHRV
jgi:hypothetical protein